MPNKYSHALVLSHYESRGLISFPHRNPPDIAEPFDSEPTLHPSFNVHQVSVPSSPPRAPLPPLPPTHREETHREDSITSSPSSHRATPSIITEIYAPEPLTDSLKLESLQLESEPQDGKISSVETKWNTLTSEASSLVEETPRTSVSSVRASTRKDVDWEDGRPFQSPYVESSRSSNDHGSSVASGGAKREYKREISTHEGPPPKSFEAFANPHSFFYSGNCFTRPKEPRSGTPPILRLESHPQSRSSRTSSPDEAAPPPISRRKHLITPANKKTELLNFFKKPAKTNNARAPLTIMDLTPEVAPWESVPVPDQSPPLVPGGKSSISETLPVKLSLKPETALHPLRANPSSKKSSRNKISRGKRSSDKKAETEKKLPRNDVEEGMIARASRALSLSEEDFIAQFETEGYFWR